MVPSGVTLVKQAYGFGYDPSTNDYKLVKSAYFFYSNPPSEVNVYSLRSNSWRKTKGCPFSCIQEDGILANNALHWLIPFPWSKRKVIAFDLVEEEYNLVPLPECVHEVEDICMDLRVLEGCLCVGSLNRKVGIEMWVMKQYGIKDSRTKLFFQTRDSIFDYLLSPVAYSRGGDKILLKQHGHLAWYDLIKKRIEEVQDVEISGEVRMCMGSLVAPKDSSEIDDGKRKQTVVEKKNKKNRKRKNSRSVELKLGL